MHRIVVNSHQNHQSNIGTHYLLYPNCSGVFHIDRLPIEKPGHVRFIPYIQSNDQSSLSSSYDVLVLFLPTEYSEEIERAAIFSYIY